MVFFLIKYLYIILYKYIMGSKSTSYLKSLTNPKGHLSDFRHAARLFDDDDIRLAPKLKFQYHVSFVINPQALKSMNFNYRHQQEFNMLVKSADLPKFSIQTETLNQYNRRKVVHVKLDYQPVNIIFHEDNFNVVRMFWENYYSYYFADNEAAKVSGNYNRTAMLGASSIKSPYGFDNGSTVPFFSSISIYLMARKYWSMAKLINPVVTAFNHDTMNYADTGPSQNSMTVAYEAVTYDYGSVSKGNPPGFAQDHYDHVPSPLSVAGGGTESLFGTGGVLAGMETVFGNVASGKAFESPANLITTAIHTINTYQNAKSLTKSGISNELQNIAVKGLQTAARAGPGSIGNSIFQIPSTTNNETRATPYQGNNTPGGI